MANLRSSIIDLDAADCDILPSEFQDRSSRDHMPGSGGLIECSTSASVSQEKISTVSKGASRLRQLDICDGMDADLDLMVSPVPQSRPRRRGGRQDASMDARRASLAIAKNFDLAVAEDGLLGEDEMSQLSGKALDLRNSAALLKLARMSVDKMTQPTGAIKAHRPGALDLAHSSDDSARCAGDADLAGAPSPILAESPRLPAAGGRPPRARGPPPLRGEQAGLRASTARATQMPKMLASISENFDSGLSAEDDEEGSPLATTRIYAERGRGTFSPPDMLRDSMALFLQLEGAVTETSPFKPAEVLRMHADRQVSVAASVPPHAAAVEHSAAQHADVPGTEAQKAPVGPAEAPAPAQMSRAAKGTAASTLRPAAASSLRRPTALNKQPSKAVPTSSAVPGASGQPGKPGNTPQSALQRIHQRVSDAAARARGHALPPKQPAAGPAMAPSRAAQGTARPAGGSGRADTRTAHGAAVARSVPREPAFNGKAEASGAASTRPGRGAAAPRRGGPAAAHSSVRPAPAKAPHQAAKVKSSSHEAAQGGAASRAPGQHLGRLRPGPLAAGRVPSSPEKQAQGQKTILRPGVNEQAQHLQQSKLPIAGRSTPPPPQASPGFLRMLEEALHAEEQGKPFGGTGRGLTNSPAEQKEEHAPTRLTAEQRHCLEYRDD